MKRLQSFLKRLAKKGFATNEEKEKMWALYKELSDEQQEDIASEVDKVDEMPEEAPKGADDDNADDDTEEVEKTMEKLFADLQEKIGADMAKEVEAAVKKQIEVNQKRAGINAGTQDFAAKRKALNNYMSKFLNALVGEDTAVIKEMTTDDAATPYSGYAVDSELSAEIRHLMTQYGVARREMLALQLTKNSYKANSLVTDVIVYWVDQAAAIGSTQPVLGQSTLELNKLGAIVTLTNELLEDQEIDLVAFIAERVAEGFALKEDTAFFNGDGTSATGSFTGLLQNESLNEVVMAGSTFASITADDLINMQDSTPQGAQANAKYYMHRTIKSYLRKLKDDNGQYIYSRPSESTPALIWEKPVVEVEAMPAKTASAADTSFVLYGDLKKACLLGYKGNIRAAMFDAGVIRNVADTADINLITTDRIAVRWVERVGFLVLLPTAATKLTTAPESA